MSKASVNFKKQIEIDKEMLSALPKNNKKNTSRYIEMLESVISEYNKYTEDITKELQRRAKKINAIQINGKINELEKEIFELKEYRILNKVNTSYEKMRFDEVIFNIRRFYRNRLDKVNEYIYLCIELFSEVGVKLRETDFNFSPYVREYMTVFFEGIDNGNINSEKIKTTFEKLYWKCSDIIVHIEVNLRAIYYKYEKRIEKSVQYKKEKFLKRKEITEIQFLDEYRAKKEEILNLKRQDVKIILDNIFENESEIRNYEPKELNKIYSELLDKPLDTYSAEEIEDINTSFIKLSDNLYEYKEYAKFKFLIEQIKSIYKNKERYKDSFKLKRSEIEPLEKKLIKLNDEYNKLLKSKSRAFNKSIDNSEKIEKITMQINSLILEIKKLYMELDKEKINSEVANKIDDNSSMYDILYFVASYYSFLEECIIKNNTEITDEERKQTVREIREFVRFPNLNIINNISFKEEKNIVFMIKDKYNLFNINLKREDLEENLEDFEVKVKTLVNSYYLNKNGISLNDIKFISKTNKILDEIENVT